LWVSLLGGLDLFNRRPEVPCGIWDFALVDHREFLSALIRSRSRVSTLLIREATSSMIDQSMRFS